MRSILANVISMPHPFRKKKARRRQGAMLVLICVMIFAFLVTVAFSVDVAYMNLVKSELRSATDAAAKAAGETLARTQDVSASIVRGRQIALENRVANTPLSLRDSDFSFGKSELGNDGRFTFRVGATPMNSVRVNGQRTNGSLSGNVKLFFGRIFNVNAFQPEEFCTATFIQRDIVLVVDRSGSMNDLNKFNELRAAIGIFTQILQDSPVDERVGLASYSTTETEDVELSEDLSTINAAMSRMPVEGFTNISGGIDAGGRIMSRARSRDFVERTMIVLTDGLQNRGRPARIAAREQAALGTTIHAITFGRDADQTAMQEVANIGGGRFFHADNGVELRRVFREIALTLSTIITE
ncbi:MAG: vWA domain-containing protein [Pirellula sp.]